MHKFPLVFKALRGYKVLSFWGWGALSHDIVLFGNHVFGKIPYLVTNPITKPFTALFRFPKFNIFGKIKSHFWGFSMFLGSFLGKLCTFLGILYSFSKSILRRHIYAKEELQRKMWEKSIVKVYWYMQNLWCFAVYLRWLARREWGGKGVSLKCSSVHRRLYNRLLLWKDWRRDSGKGMCMEKAPYKTYDGKTNGYLKRVLVKTWCFWLGVGYWWRIS